MKKLGVIGGMGPFATVYFYELLTKMQVAASEQAYLDILIYSKPSIPDRTAYILDPHENDPTPFILEAGETLAAAGAEIIVIPCVTAHFFYDELAKRLKVPLLSILDETANCLGNAHFKKVGLLATKGTLQSRLFQKVLEPKGISVVTTNEDEQQCLMDIIYREIKQGATESGRVLQTLTERLYENGAETVILGCTELSLLSREMRGAYIDPMVVLARQALLACGAVCQTG